MFSFFPKIHRIWASISTEIPKIKFRKGLVKHNNKNVKDEILYLSKFIIPYALKDKYVDATMLVKEIKNNHGIII